MKTPPWLAKGKTILAGLLLFVVGIGAGIYLAPLLNPPPARIKDVREFDNKYHFISPLLACSSDVNIDDGQVKQLQTQLQNSITLHEQQGDISTASIYFRDLNGGPWVGINFDKPFSPGSLLKVPLAMSVYKIAEGDPSILEKKVQYTGTETTSDQYFEPAPLPTGMYTVRELVQHMLINSNNNAANALATAVGADAFEATYDHLGIAKPPVEGTDYTTTTHDYASFFRILYNATYLDDDGSETLLQTLSQAAFIDGLVAGVPKGVVVSHKFGERSVEGSLTLQLHDCGIVYAPNHPYLICVMTQGSSYQDMAKTIADLSNLVYNYVE